MSDTHVHEQCRIVDSAGESANVHGKWSHGITKGAI
jgi:hypothetical protein